MKFRNSAVFFSFVLVFSLLNVPFVPAPSHPEYFDFVEDCSEGQHYDPLNRECRAPEDLGYIEPPGFFGGFFGKVKLAFANPETKARLSAVLTAKQTAMLEKALADEDYVAARMAAENIRQTLENSGKYLEDFGVDKELDYEEWKNGEGTFYDYRNAEFSWNTATGRIYGIKEELQKKIEAGEISQEEADKILGGLGTAADEISMVMAHKEKEIADKLVEDSGGKLTGLEMEYALKKEDSKWGFDKVYYKQVDRGDIAYNRFALDSLKKEISESDELEIGDVDELFLEARIAQQDARDALVNEDYKGAYENFHEAEYIIGVLEDYSENGEGALRGINPEIGKTFEEINKEIEQAKAEIISDYETEGVRDKIIESYPEYQTELDKTYTEAVAVEAVSDKIGELEEKKIDELEAKGYTEEDARAEIEELTAKEYFYADGGKDYPAGYIEFLDDDGDGIIETNYGGGFFKGMEYHDYYSDFDYVMGADGFNIKSPLTETSYLVKHPEDYSPERFEKGDEKFEYEYETEKGKYNYEYMATGYRVTAPDGIEQIVNYADVSPVVTAVGGTEFRYNAVGYDVISNGEATRWTMNPAYGVYKDMVSGKVFTPEEGMMHYGDVVYNDGGFYEYTVGQTKVEFNPETNEFEINDKTKISAPVPEAPVGLEEEALESGGILTEHGEKWAYDEATATWTSEKTDEEGNSEIKEIVLSPQEVYRYDEEDKEYVDFHGEVQEEAVFAETSWELVQGKWVSQDSGMVYDPATGVVTQMFGDAIAVVAEGAAGEVSSEEKEGKFFGRVYDKEGKEIKRYTFDTGGRYVYDPTQGATGGYAYVRWDMPDYDYVNPPTYEQKDTQGNVISVWTQDKDGRWYQAGQKGEKIYPGYENYYKSEAFAEVGRKVTYDGKEYFVDPEKGWATTDAEGNIYAVGPPPGQPSSAVHVMGRYYNAYDDYDSRYDRNYNYVVDGNAYYFPSGMDPSSLTAEQKEKYKVENARGYDPAFGTCFGDCSAGGYGRYGYTTYGSTGAVAVAGTAYMDTSGTTWTKTESGSWTSSDGRTYGSPPGYTDARSGVPYAIVEDYGYGYRNYNYYGSYSTAGPSTSSYGYSPVGTTVVGDDGRTYTVTSEKGWTDDKGNAVAPPSVGGTQMPSSTGSSGPNYNPGYYDSKGNWVPPSSGTSGTTYSGGGYYDNSGTWHSPSETGGYSSGGNYYTSPGYYGGAYSGGYYGGTYAGGTPYSSYPGGYYGSYGPAGPNYDPAAAASAGYPGSGAPYGCTGNACGSYSTSGPNAWTAGGTYSGYAYDSSTGTYVPSSSSGYNYGSVGGGTYSSATGTYSYGGYSYSGGTYDSSTGTYSGGYTSGGSYDSSTGTYSGGTSTTSPGDSGGTSSGSGGTTSSGSGGTTSSGDSGGSTGVVVSTGYVSSKISRWIENLFSKKSTGGAITISGGITQKSCKEYCSSYKEKAEVILIPQECACLKNGRTERVLLDINLAQEKTEFLGGGDFNAVFYAPTNHKFSGDKFLAVSLIPNQNTFEPKIAFKVISMQQDFLSQDYKTITLVQGEGGTTKYSKIQLGKDFAIPTPAPQYAYIRVLAKERSLNSESYNFEIIFSDSENLF